MKHRWWIDPNGVVIPRVSGGMDPPFIEQDGFRGRDDDVGANSTTWNGGGLENANWTQAVDTNFRIRFTVSNTGGDGFTFRAKIQYNLAAAGWNDVSDTSPIAWATSIQYTSGVDITSQLTSGQGSFDSDSNSSEAVHGTNLSPNSGFTLSVAKYCEEEFCLTIDSAQVSDAQTFQLRLINSSGSTYDQYNQTPTITVDEGGGPAPTPHYPYGS